MTVARDRSRVFLRVTYDKHFLRIALVASSLLSVTTAAGAQSSTDPSLMAEIRRIRAIDNHAHPPKLVSSGEKDDEFDALPCDPLEPTQPGLITRADNPQYLAAWKDLWGCGQGIGAVKDVRPASEIVRRLSEEYAQAQAELAKKIKSR